MYHKSELITSSAPLIDQEAVLSTIPTNGFQTLGAGGLGGVSVAIFTVKFEFQMLDISSVELFGNIQSQINKLQFILSWRVKPVDDQ